MAYVVVTLEYDQRKIDLALPMHIPTGLLVEGILKVLQLPQQGRQVWLLGVKEEGRIRRIPRDVTFGDVEVLHGTVLTLIGEEGAVVTPPKGVFLRSSEGRVFPLEGRKEWVLGRNDPRSGIVVDIDLSMVAREPHAISRRHVRIEQEGERFYLIDLHSKNGTFLNGREIPPDERQPLHDGDEIVLGRNAVRLTFYAGLENEPRP